MSQAVPRPCLTETEMLRNLNKEFRGNGLSGELYSRLIRNGAVMHMKNACSPVSREVKISTARAAAGSAPRWSNTSLVWAYGSSEIRRSARFTT